MGTSDRSEPAIILLRSPRNLRWRSLSARDIPRAEDLIALKRVARYTIKNPRMACRYVWTPLDSNIGVYGDANFAGCTSTRKSTVGGVVLWSGHFVNRGPL